MNRSTLAIATALIATGSTAGASLASLDGIATYSVELSDDTAVLGDTITVEVHLDLEALNTPFTGLSVALFNMLSTDPMGPSGTIDNTSPGLGLAFDWLPLGVPGAVVGDDIFGIQAGQFPAINGDDELLLYTYEYTVGDGTPRNIVIAPDHGGANVLVFGANFLDIREYDTFAESATLSVVPAPGAFALLGAAGLAGRRRRRG